MAKKNNDNFDDDPEVVNAVEEFDEIRARGARQLRSGRLRRLNDQIAGGPRRPGEQEISRSPFVLTMFFLILGLGIVAAVFYFLILRETEKSAFDSAARSVSETKYNEGIVQFENFLLAYPSGEYANRARILLQTAKIKRHTDSTTFSVESAVEAQGNLEEFFRTCQDLPEFQEERDKVIRFAEKISRAAAEVAIKNGNQQALDASQAAYARLDSITSGAGSLTSEARQRILRLHSRASAEILKRDVLKESMDEIKENLNANRPLQALSIYQGLMDRYEVLRDDSGYRRVLQDILKKEQTLVTVEELSRDALTEEANEARRPSLSINLQTSVTAGLLSQGKKVFGTGGDVVFAMDSETGLPEWKRRIGADSPFAPIVVEGQTPGLLLFHGGRNEVQLVRQDDGSLVWRQSVESPASGLPLVLDQEIFVATDAGDLWQISVSSGRAMNKVHFRQPIQGPVAVSRDGESLLVPGRGSFVYTLSRRSLECRAVSFTEHGKNTVRSPMIPMGKVFLFCQNQNEKCILRAMRMNADGQLEEQERQTIEGQVNDPCLLRGDQLFVPSTPQRITAFRIADRADGDIFSLIDTNQLENAAIARMFLVSGSGGNLWMASTSLRHFRVTTQSVLLDEAVVAEGHHLFPIQSDDTSLMVTTTAPWSSSIFFTRVDRDSMVGQWRTVLKTNLVAAGASTSGNSLLAVSDFGEIFRVPLKEIGSGGFYSQAISDFRLPDGLQDPVSGVALADGRLAAWCFGDEARAWTTTGTGQLEQSWRLPASPEVPPIPFAGGLAVALPGRLRLTATRLQSEDYRIADADRDDVVWKSLVALNDTQLLAIRSDDQIIQVEYRSTPDPHLAEIGVTQLRSQVEVAPVAADGYVCMATVEGKLMMMRSAGLELVKEHDLQTVINRAPIQSGGMLFAQTADGAVHTLRFDDTLESTGSFPSPGGHLVAPPLALAGGEFLAAFSHGTVVRLDQQGRPTDQLDDLGQQLQLGPVTVDNSFIVIAADGSLFLLDDLAGNQ